MTCKDINEFLADYLAGELPVLRRLAFDAHVALCPNCQRFLRSYKQATALGKTAYDEPAAKVPEDLVRAILAAREGGTS